jgi:hypothetical protein
MCLYLHKKMEATYLELLNYWELQKEIYLGKICAIRYDYVRKIFEFLKENTAVSNIR